MVNKTRTRSKDKIILSILLIWGIFTISACEKTLFYIPEPTSTPWVVKAETRPSLTPQFIPDTSQSIESPTMPAVETETAPIEESTQTIEPAPPRISNTPGAPVSISQGNSEGKPILYYTQAGDTLDSVAVRFGVWPEEITSSSLIPPKEFISPQQLLVIPNVLDDIGPNSFLLPDSEIVNSPSAIGFDVAEFVENAGGFLSSHRQSIADGTYSGAEIVERVALENSINPRLLLAILEYQSNWVYGSPEDAKDNLYPIGLDAF